MLSVHLANGSVAVRELAAPSRAPGFALIRLLVAGICNTDLELQRGYYDFSGTPGHEFVGEVVAADTPSLVGQRVVGEINIACENCDWCRRGLGRHCPHRTVLGIVNHPGAFSEFFTLPERNLHVLPPHLPADQAVFTEPLAAACEILDQVAIPADSPVALLGDGKLGLLIALVLRAHGHTVHHFGKHPEKLAISAQAGATTHTSTDLPVASFDYVIDATGSSAGLDSALQLVRPRGTIILKSTVHDRAAIDWARVIVNEITLVGSRCGRFEPALHLLASRQVDVSPLLADRFPLTGAAGAFARAAQPGTLKVLLSGPPY